MQNQNASKRNSGTTRREFMRNSAAVVGGALIVNHALSSAVYAGESNTLKLGLIGCGGRGTGAAVNALGADENTELVAMADTFMDKVDEKLEHLQISDYGDRVLVEDDGKFDGLDGYKGVIEKADVVLLATPPQFRPLHLKAAIDAGKHVFCEKPVGVDPAGVRSVLETCRVAQDKKLSVVSGLCYRYDEAKIEIVKRIHDGAVGDFTFLQTNYLTGGLWSNPRKPEWSDTEWQIRNWLYFTWLSGDHIVEQHVHSLDKILWVMKDEPPARVIATGGRAQRTEPHYGNIYDHFTSTFEWKNGVRCIAQCRQFVNAESDTSDWVFGNKGVAELMNHKITGANAWSRKASPINMYDAEHIAMFQALRKGEPINNGDYMCKSTLMGIMARESAYTGKAITWDEISSSQLRLGPEVIDMKAKLDVPPVPVPGRQGQA